MTVPYQLNSVFREVFDDPLLVVHPDTSPADIADWDSVAQVKLVLTIEESFGVRFTTEQVSSLHCVADFVNVVNRVQPATQSARRTAVI